MLFVLLPSIQKKKSQIQHEKVVETIKNKKSILLSFDNANRS